ncbi:MAG: bifunctional 4-hydroxy-2-oxoglutarate aldolase/2-dehydro-3-deoxy-phosphogluconate aldolase [Chitinophagaceae bacterium]
MPAAFSWSLFQKMPVIGILRNILPLHSETIADLYFECGFTTLEITMNSPGAAATISSLSERFADKLNIGAGTVCTLEDLEEAVSAGASFIVTPVLSEEVIKAAVIKNIPIFPGAFTPSEIYRAWMLGASMVKVFPATALGPGFIKDILAPLPYLKLIPTGGVSMNNFNSFLQAGAAGVGVGSTLFPANLIKEEKWDKLSELFLRFKHSIS